MMWTFLVAGAAIVDAFACGIWLGKKWGDAGVQAALAKAGIDLAAVEAKVAPMVAVVETDAAAAEAKIKAAIEAAKATAPK